MPARASADGERGDGAGRLAGIARRAASRAPMETLDRVSVTHARGIEGDFRGLIRPGGRGRRQVSLIERADWATAMAIIGQDIPWFERRANLLVDDFDLPQIPGARLRIGAVLLEVTTECDPCVRMEKVAPGLEAALTPDWRGGVLARVLEEGAIAVGDQIRIEEP